MPKKISIDPVIAGRIKTAWDKLPDARKARLAPAILNANHQAVTVVETGAPPAAAAAPHHLVLAQSVLSNDSDSVVSRLDAAAVITVDGEGVIWGTGKWEQFDPGWTEALAAFLESALLGSVHPFATNPQTISIPDTVQIGLAGDWGTGDWRPAPNLAPSTDVKIHLGLLKLDLTIHLGDVYYAGTGDQEQYLLVNLWPKGAIGSLSLNSNHEMYSGANGYFKAIANPPFEIQKGCSFFALENSHWIIVGLDSAYYSDDDNLYIDGALFPGNKPNEQNAFLLQKGADAQASGRKLILLTHHNGLDDKGSTPNALWQQVMNAYPAGGGPDYWYWGHVHIGAVYKPFGPANVRCRCCGHGALPWGHASDLAESPSVEWYENRNANDPEIPERVLNGFAVLRLDGPTIKEIFYDENGGVAWQSP
jgi:Calcineurin-like phosphoesterase